MKNIVVVVDQLPNLRMEEKLRMSVGLTLSDDNALSVLLVDDGVYTGIGRVGDEGSVGAEIEKHLSFLGALNVPVYVSSDSMNRRGVSVNRPNVKFADENETDEIFRNSDITIT